jgi:hypothetical protein
MQMANAMRTNLSDTKKRVFIGSMFLPRTYFEINFLAITAPEQFVAFSRAPPPKS